ncbi:MAG: Hsp70 family protein [Candidatus Dojkabacteria bacterium]|nr:Hsp70 family protein [Candidatus Dojkabacteria bacterium]
MARNKIDYGIDLGTTNSAISRMENGEPIIKKTDTLKDTMPSCLFFNKKRSIQVGDSAFNALKRDKLKSMKDSEKNLLMLLLSLKEPWVQINPITALIWKKHIPPNNYLQKY